MTSRPIIWFLCASALVLAGGPHVRHNESSASPTDPRPMRQSERRGGGEQVLATSANVDVKDGLTFTLHVTNVADHTVELRFPSGQTHDFVVLDSLGHRLWRWSDGRLFTQALQNRMLDSKETVTYEEHWDPAGRSGQFTAVALLKSSNYPVEERVTFSLP